MLEWWKQWRKRATLKSYRTKLRAKLRELYGADRYYSPGRVRRAAAESGVNQEHIVYAYAMYCSADRYYEVLELSRSAGDGSAPSFEAARHEIVDSTGSAPTSWTAHGDSHHSEDSYGSDGGDYGGFDGHDAGGGGDGGGSDGRGD
jgi:hypothetical protein